MPRGQKERQPRFSYTTDTVPAVTVFANPHRGEMLTLRWGKGAERRMESLGTRMTYSRRGKPDPTLEAWAKLRAAEKSVALANGTTAVEVTPAPTSRPGADPGTFTIGMTWPAISHPETGKYPHKTEFRDEVERALLFAGQVWGPATPWSAIDDDSWQTLMVRRLKALLAEGRQGIRGTQVTMSRLITVTRWLRKKKLIPHDAGHAPDDWKADLVKFWKGETKSKRDPVVSRPRHTPEEITKIVAAAHTVDPRFGLLCELAVEYRLGQAVRSMRSDLDLEAGTFTIHGAGTKQGEVVLLTAGQLAAARAALDGILAPLERRYQAGELADYPLFPAGYVRFRDSHGRDRVRLGTLRQPLRPASENWVIANWHASEDVAKVPRVKGRAAYGGRRARLDETLKHKPSDSGLQAAGGWSTTKIPLEVYRDESNRLGREEARTIRAKLRGEPTPAPEEGESR